MENKNPLSLEQKEIVLIFCLFIFVALLMFTVGILVGKGLTQAKFEKKHFSEKQTVAETVSPQKPGAGTIVSSNSETKAPEKIEEAPTQPEHVEWIPQKKEATLHSSQNSLLEPQKTPTEEILRNPSLKSVIEDTSPRHPASAPDSFSTGKFTVQIASYPSQKDAQERVETLKKLGFANSYFSVNQMEHTNETWYRVWLGFFPNFQAANQAGNFLKERGEVKQYLVRKTDNSGKEN